MKTAVIKGFINFLILMVLSPFLCSGQTDISPLSSDNVFSYYDQLFQNDSRLVNGEFYLTPQMSESRGHPFFISSDWKAGSVAMEGIIFDNLQMRYDISSGLIILNTAGFTNSAVQLVLKKDRINYFTLDGKLFQPYPENDPMTGIRFCEVLAEGEIDLLLIKSKNLKVTTTGMSDYAYQERQNKNLRINDELHLYLSRRSLIKLFPDQKNKLKSYLKENRLRFKKMSLIDHIGFVRYCNSLIEIGNDQAI